MKTTTGLWRSITETTSCSDFLTRLTQTTDLSLVQASFCSHLPDNVAVWSPCFMSALFAVCLHAGAQGTAGGRLPRAQHTRLSDSGPGAAHGLLPGLRARGSADAVGCWCRPLQDKHRGTLCAGYGSQPGVCQSVCVSDLSYIHALHTQVQKRQSLGF